MAITRQWRHQYGVAVRVAYKAAALKTITKDRSGADLVGWNFTSENELRSLVKIRHARDVTSRLERFGTTLPPIDAWILHCATRDAIAMRRARPDGRVVFGTKESLQRRDRGLISQEAWRECRLRPMTSLGDKIYKGNRHFRLSADARYCVVTILKTSIKLEFPKLFGKWGEILPAVAALAAGDEMNVTFKLGSKTLDITFDPMDLRKLPPGQTLQTAKDLALADVGKRSRGRSRGLNYASPRLRVSEVARFIHPEWRDRIPAVSSRMLGIDLNPGWIGIAVVENSFDATSLDHTKFLDHKLIKLDLDKDATDETVRELLAKVCGEVTATARAWNCNQVTMEAGLGKLRSGGRNRSLNRLLNFWARTVFGQQLRRKCTLAGIEVYTAWGGYSTTIGNTAFDLPDACASAAEMARRGLSSLTRTKEGIFPKYGADLISRRWKDERLSLNQSNLVETAVNWVEYHQALKTAKLGVRRPHSTYRSLPGSVGVSSDWNLDRHAVRRLGHKHRPGLVARPVPASMPMATEGFGAARNNFPRVNP